MSVEENLQAIKDGIEAANAQDWDRFFEGYAESFVYSDPTLPEPLKGLATWRELIQTYDTAFPDLRFEEVRTFGQGDWVCREATGTGPTRDPSRDRAGRQFPLRISLSVFRAAPCTRSRAEKSRRFATTSTSWG